MSPAQRFVRDQSFAYAKATLRDLCNDNLVTACLREGIENLYFLGHFWKGEDTIVRVSGGRLSEISTWFFFIPDQLVTIISHL